MDTRKAEMIARAIERHVPHLDDLMLEAIDQLRTEARETRQT
jgi:hypothetical protein